MKIFASFATGVAFSPPNGRSFAWSSARSDLRVTGSVASAARERISSGLIFSRMRAKPGALALACAICRGSAAISAASRSSEERVSRAS